MEFKASAQSTLGIEWELALVDATTGRTAPRNHEIIPEVRRRYPGGPHRVDEEFMLNTVELVTGVCHTVSEGLDQLAVAGTQLEQVAAEHGLALFSQGVHPLSFPMAETVAPAQRYQKMLERTQWWGQQMIIYGVHVHVGIAHRDQAMPVINHLINHYPHLLALSASSPIWEGFHTGYASQRAQIFQQLPTSGLPFQFETWDGFETAIADLTHTGVIDDVTEARWDIRPVPRFGTIEMRVCDGVSTLKEIGALAALTQCLAHEAATGDQPIEIMQPWHVQENKWRASRYGMEAVIITNTAGDEMLVGDHLSQVLERLAPIAQQLGCSTELAWVEQLIADGEPARGILEAVGDPQPLDRVDDETLLRFVRDSAAETAGSLAERMARD